MNKVEDKKELIREAAVQIMSKQGFYNTKASQIADEAGIAVGTIYNYFNNKESILDYIFEVELKKRLGYLKMMQEENNSFWGKLELFLDNHFREIRENPSVGEILVREKEFPKKNGSVSINEYLTRIPQGLEELLVKAKEDGEVKASVNTTVIASVIFGGIQGLVEKAINSDLDMLVNGSEQMIDLLKEGLT